ELHVSAKSNGSRRAFGDRSFSASSRWHSSTSLSASRRFALASARVSPCEMAAGTSSTKQVYPPSLAGSKTAVNFMVRGCHTTPPLASGREERSHAEHGLLNTDHSFTGHSPRSRTLRSLGLLPWPAETDGRRRL